MINNTGANISMTRGDDVAIHINIWEVAADGTKTAYELEEGDTLTLTIKHNSDADDSPVIQKVFTTQNLIIDHDDTKALEYGLYLYDVVLTSATNKIYTLLMATLELTKEGGIENADP